MPETLEVAIVTVAALVAFAVLVWPLVPRKRGREAPKAGCAACEQHPKADRIS